MMKYVVLGFTRKLDADSRNAFGTPTAEPGEGVQELSERIKFSADCRGSLTMELLILPANGMKYL